ncbi:MAG: D-sedoheptulose 7-phosphate isomerase [Candidatus Omnitrophota bacterium]|nr:D-sedoheptulose 7-phosphate isomerase [Candidatus Omnitrophota bacterium]
MKNKIEEIIEESIAVKKDLVKSQSGSIEKAAKAMISALKAGGKIVIFGNGGSAADSQHIAAELVGRFLKERKGLPAIALTTNTSILTAIANDYSYNQVFSRQVDALAEKNDVAIGISTSGKAANVIEAIEFANKKGLVTIALTGGDGGGLAKVAKISIIVPSRSTPRIQESHVTIGHIICQLVEDAL